MKAEPQVMTIPSAACRHHRQFADLHKLNSSPFPPHKQPVFAATLGKSGSLEPQMPWKQCRALTRRCQAITSKSCEVATIRLAYEMLDAGNEDRSVAYQERNPERNRHNRTRALPFSGLLRTVAIRGQRPARILRGRRARAFPAPAGTPASENQVAPRQMSPGLDPAVSVRVRAVVAQAG